MYIDKVYMFFEKPSYDYLKISGVPSVRALNKIGKTAKISRLQGKTSHTSYRSKKSVFTKSLYWLRGCGRLSKKQQKRPENTGSARQKWDVILQSKTDCCMTFIQIFYLNRRVFIRRAFIQLIRRI